MNLVWLRNDLRLEDNPALYYGAKQGDVCCVYIISQKQWLEHDDAKHKIQLWQQRLIEVAQELQQKKYSIKNINCPALQERPKKTTCISSRSKRYRVISQQRVPT